MKNILFFLLSLILTVPFLSKDLQGAGAAKDISGFDLFTYSLSSLDQPLGQRAQALGKALVGSFPKTFSKYFFKENAYEGACFKGKDDFIRLAWHDSETEGFSFSLEKLAGQKSCVSPFSEGTTFKTFPLDAKTFFPISHRFPALALGLSTPSQIKAELGTPDYSDPEKLIYVLKRDKEKEKGCDANPGEFYAIDVIFKFKDGKLSGVWLDNSIAGEC